MKKLVRCAIIGVGSMGKKYAKMIAEGNVIGLSLSVVLCRGDVSANWAKDNLANVLVVRTEDELYLNKDLFDAVIIVTPHKLHPEMSIRALKERKHVLTDKPQGVFSSVAKEINIFADNKGLIYSMMCHQRTYMKYRKVKELLDSNIIGKIERISMLSTNFLRTRSYHLSSSWRSSWIGEGGGVLINQGYHLLDMWYYLFGLPESIYANIPFGKYNPFLVDDEATLIMNYKDKVTGTFIITTGEGASSERLEIIGTKGKILLEDNKLILTKFNTDIRDYLNKASATSRQDLLLDNEEYIFEDEKDAYKIMLENFSKAILNKDKLICNARDGSCVLEIVNASYLSAWLDKKIILPLDEKEYEKAFLEKEEEERNYV